MPCDGERPSDGPSLRRALHPVSDLRHDWVRFVSFVLNLAVRRLEKRYAPYYWLFACGPVGLVVVCCLRSLKLATTPEEYERMEVRANLIGSVLTGIALFCSVGLMGLLALLLFV